MNRLSERLFQAGLAALAVACLAGVPPVRAASPAEPMRPVSLADWGEVLEQQQPAVVVADLWASWCVSCIERFPKMVALTERYQARGVRFITLNFDDPQDVSGIDWANEFLAGLGGSFAHYHMAENLVRSFEALNLMALPVVLIFDGAGQERYRLSNDDPNHQFTEADIEQALDTLLAERGPD